MKTKIILKNINNFMIKTNEKFLLSIKFEYNTV